MFKLKNMLKIFALLLIAVSAVSMADSVDDNDGPHKTLVGPLYTFVSKLYPKLGGNSGKLANRIVSPISIHQALSLLALGADQNSETETQLRNVLGYSQSFASNQNKNPHEAYKTLVESLDQVTKVGLRGLERRNNSTEKQRISFQDNDGEDRAPIVEVRDFVVTKDTELTENYLKQAKNYYNTSIDSIESSKPESAKKVVDKVNKWAKDAGFDGQVIGESDFEQIKAMLISAIRLQAFWPDELYEDDEAEDMFLNDGLSSKVVRKGTILGQTNLVGKYIEFTSTKSKLRPSSESIKKKFQASFEELAKLNFHAIEMEMRGGVTFSLIEPLNSGNGTELSKLLADLLEQPSGNGEQTKLAKLMRLLDKDEARQRFDHVSFPAFKLEEELKLVGPLTSIGLGDLFDPNKAKFSQITQEKLRLSDARHSAIVEVNKYGIKAAGITILKAVPMSLYIPVDPLRVAVKSPFLFVIRYKKVPLFIGQLVRI